MTDEGSFFAERPLAGAKKFEEGCSAALVAVSESRVLKSCGVRGASSLRGAALAHPSGCLGSCDHHSSSHGWEFGEPVCCEV